MSDLEVTIRNSMSLRLKLIDLQAQFDTLKKVIRDQSKLQLGEMKHFMIDGSIARLEMFKNGELGFSVVKPEELV